MIKLLSLSIFFIGVFAFGQDPHHDKSTHHALMHAGHWTSSRMNAPHSRFRGHYPKRHHKDKSVHHATVHAEHWLNHHLSAPHKHP